MNAHTHDRSLLKSFLAVALVTAILLALPLLAMQFTSEMRWGLEDFVAAGALIFGAGAGFVLVTRHARRTGHRVALIAAIALVVAVVWAELAVGIFS